MQVDSKIDKSLYVHTDTLVNMNMHEQNDAEGVQFLELSSPEWSEWVLWFCWPKLVLTDLGCVCVCVFVCVVGVWGMPLRVFCVKIKITCWIF